MMKAGKLCVSAIFRPVPSVAKSGKCACLRSVIQLRLLFRSPRVVLSEVGLVNAGAKSGHEIDQFRYVKILAWLRGLGE